MDDTTDAYLISKKAEAIQNKIAAQEMLLRNSKAYKLTPEEIKQTQSALVSYIAELQQFRGDN